MGHALEFSRAGSILFFAAICTQAEDYFAAATMTKAGRSTRSEMV